MENIEVIITSILKIAAFITAIGAAWAYIKRWNAESRSTRNSEKLEMLKDKQNEHELRLKELEKDAKKSDSYINAMCSAMLALLDHNINGNSIDKLKEAKEEMKEFLIHRG